MDRTDVAIASELRVSPRLVSLCLVAVGATLIILSDDMFSSVSRLRTVVLGLLCYALAAIAFWVDCWRPDAARWFAVFSLVGLVLGSYSWVNVTELAPLIVIPAVAAASLIGVRAALSVGAVETALLLLLRDGVGLLTAKGASSAVALGILWSVLGFMLAMHESVRQFVGWAWGYFRQARDLLEETRDRKADLERALSDLKHANRHLALANERITALRTIAEDAQRTKTAFVAKVSHELRTPLNMIIGLVSLIVRNPDVYGREVPSAVLEDLGIVQRNCEHLSSLINDVLALSQADSGRLALHRERVDLEEIIHRSSIVIQPLIEKKGLYLRTSTPADLPSVYCDRTRIRQVIVNLLSNAARFSETGGITVKVVWEEQRVRVSVADTGPGISPEDAERVFEPFCQGPGWLWQDNGGSGLGLSISKQFVLLHGGQIWLESSLGQGTTFFFELPISSPIAHIARSGHQISQDWVWMDRSSRPKFPDTHYRPRILVYDEMGSLYPALSQMSDEVEFVATSSSSQALEQLRECPAHVLMANASSPEVLWSKIAPIRGQAPDTPIVGCCVPPKLATAPTSHAIDYLVKPVSCGDMSEVLSTAGEAVRRVLVVDDDSDVLRLWTAMLHACRPDLEVLPASSGAEALEILHTAQPDLMLLDIVMPDMDGLQVLELKKQETAIRDIPVVLISARDPTDQPLASQVLLLTMGEGLSISQLFDCSLAMSELLLKKN